MIPLEVTLKSMLIEIEVLCLALVYIVFFEFLLKIITNGAFFLQKGKFRK